MRVSVAIVDRHRVVGVTSSHGLDLPGGHVEPGESLEMAAAREVREETGLVIAPADLEEVFRGEGEAGFVARRHEGQMGGERRPRWTQWRTVEKHPLRGMQYRAMRRRAGVPSESTPEGGSWFEGLRAQGLGAPEHQIAGARKQFEAFQARQSRARRANPSHDLGEGGYAARGVMKIISRPDNESERFEGCEVPELCEDDLFESKEWPVASMKKPNPTDPMLGMQAPEVVQALEGQRGEGAKLAIANMQAAVEGWARLGKQDRIARLMQLSIDAGERLSPAALVAIYRASEKHAPSLVKEREAMLVHMRARLPDRQENPVVSVSMPKDAVPRGQGKGRGKKAARAQNPLPPVPTADSQGRGENPTKQSNQVGHAVDIITTTAERKSGEGAEKQILLPKDVARALSLLQPEKETHAHALSQHARRAELVSVHQVKLAARELREDLNYFEPKARSKRARDLLEVLRALVHELEAIALTWSDAKGMGKKNQGLAASNRKMATGVKTIATGGKKALEGGDVDVEAAKSAAGAGKKRARFQAKGRQRNPVGRERLELIAADVADSASLPVGKALCRASHGLTPPPALPYVEDIGEAPEGDPMGEFRPDVNEKALLLKLVRERWVVRCNRAHEAMPGGAENHLSGCPYAYEPAERPGDE